MFAIETMTAARENQPGEHQQHVDRAADRPDQHAREQAAAAMAPSDAPAPMRPNSRLACRVSKSELAKVQACTGAITPKQFTQT